MPDKNLGLRITTIFIFSLPFPRGASAPFSTASYAQQPKRVTPPADLGLIIPVDQDDQRALLYRYLGSLPGQEGVTHP